MAQARRLEYVAFETLAEAKEHPHGYLILEGDYGGTIHVVCPAKMVHCDEDVLEKLLQDLDVIVWPDSSIEDSRIVVFEVATPGSTIAGGMGGGLATDDVWIHDELLQQGLADDIRAVLAGRKARIDRPHDQ